MKLEQIESAIVSLDPSDRLKAIAALRQYEADTAVPLLRHCICDREFIVRSFAANGLGIAKNHEAFESLVELVETESDDNVRAEAANALANYGSMAIPILMSLFRSADHWLVRQSILAAISEIGNSFDLLNFCQYALTDGDDFIQEAALGYLSLLAKTDLADKALAIILPFCTSEKVPLRVQVARTLGLFDFPEATAARIELRHDTNHYVVAATLEKSLLSVENDSN